MRVVMAAVGAVFIGLLAVGVLGVASAETTPTPTSTQMRTVSVQGTASESVASDSTASTATGVYREAMAAAITDGKEKAQFLAEKASASLGQVESITEGGGYITCPGEEEYTGGEPDFGSGTVYGVSPEVASARTSSGVAKSKKAKKHHKHAKHKRHTARAAAIEPCSLSTQVSLSYELT